MLLVTQQLSPCRMVGLDRKLGVLGSEPESLSAFCLQIFNGSCLWESLAIDRRGIFGTRSLRKRGHTRWRSLEIVRRGSSGKRKLSL